MFHNSLRNGRGKTSRYGNIHHLLHHCNLRDNPLLLRVMQGIHSCLRQNLNFRRSLGRAPTRTTTRPRKAWSRSSSPAALGHREPAQCLWAAKHVHTKRARTLQGFLDDHRQPRGEKSQECIAVHLFTLQRRDIERRRQQLGCSTSANSTSASWPESNWPKSKLAEVEIGRSRTNDLVIFFYINLEFYFSLYFFFFCFFLFLTFSVSVCVFCFCVLLFFFFFFFLFCSSLLF